MSTDLTRCEHGAYANECTQCAYARGHAAGKREGIEAAAKLTDERGDESFYYAAHRDVNAATLARDIRALLQTEAQAPRKEGET